MSGPDRKRGLLDSLALQRPKEAVPARKRWIGGSALLLLAGIVALGLFMLRDAPIPIRTARAVRISSQRNSALDASGYVVARRQATLSAKILGKLVEVSVEEGDRVTQGQIVARLDNSNYLAALKQARAQAAAAEAVLNQAKIAFEDMAPNYRRYQSLAKAGAISAAAADLQKANYDTARLAAATAGRNLAVAQAAVAVAQANEDDTIVRAPFAGVVTDKAAQPGEIVAPAAAGGGFTRTGIATIVDMASLEVQVDVSESYIDRVSPGQTCIVHLNAYPDWEIPASVAVVIPTADQNKGSVRVRIRILTSDPRILPQMGAKTSFIAGGGAEAAGVTVPLAAVLGREAPTVFVVDREQGRVFARQAAVKMFGRIDAVIESGLNPGDEVAISQLSKLRSGTRITIESQTHE